MKQESLKMKEATVTYDDWIKATAKESMRTEEDAYGDDDVISVRKPKAERVKRWVKLQK